MKYYLSFLLLLCMHAKGQQTKTDLSSYILQPFDKSTEFVFKVPALLQVTKLKLLQSDTVKERSISHRLSIDDTDDKLRIIFRNSITDNEVQLVDNITILSSKTNLVRLFISLFPDVDTSTSATFKKYGILIAIGPTYLARLEEYDNGIWGLNLSHERRK